jgi:hypothetical protein
MAEFVCILYIWHRFKILKTLIMFPKNLNNLELMYVTIVSHTDFRGLKFLEKCVGVLISLWFFLFAAQPKEFFLDGLMKLEQRSHKCVELRGEYVE